MKKCNLDLSNEKEKPLKENEQLLQENQKLKKEIQNLRPIAKKIILSLEKLIPNDFEQSKSYFYKNQFRI